MEQTAQIRFADADAACQHGQGQPLGILLFQNGKRFPDRFGIAGERFFPMLFQRFIEQPQDRFLQSVRRLGLDPRGQSTSLGRQLNIQPPFGSRFPQDIRQSPDREIAGSKLFFPGAVQHGFQRAVQLIRLILDQQIHDLRPLIQSQLFFPGRGRFFIPADPFQDIIRQGGLVRQDRPHAHGQIVLKQAAHRVLGVNADIRRTLFHGRPGQHIIKPEEQQEFRSAIRRRAAPHIRLMVFRQDMFHAPAGSFPLLLWHLPQSGHYAEAGHGDRAVPGERPGGVSLQKTFQLLAEPPDFAFIRVPSHLRQAIQHGQKAFFRQAVLQQIILRPVFQDLSYIIVIVIIADRHHVDLRIQFLQFR